MIRNVSLEEISDGRLYHANDMVKADCGDCKGCSACCRGMGRSIVLDPLDVYRLSVGLGKTFEQLLQEHLELNVVDGVILPNLKMEGKEERCTFLNAEGRCSVHPFRSGICRLFPLGRFYGELGDEESSVETEQERQDCRKRPAFQYFLQVHECRNQNRTKVKVRKWIDMPDVAAYETFVSDWHYFLKDLQKIIRSDEGIDEEKAKKISLLLLGEFYGKPFSGNGTDSRDRKMETGMERTELQDFYEQFSERLNAARISIAKLQENK